MKDVATAVGIGGGMVVVVTANVLEGGNPMSLLLLPPMLLVFGTTLRVTRAGGTMADTKPSIKARGRAFPGNAQTSGADAVPQIVSLADRARREGLLALEDAINTAEEPFLRKGLQMAVDGAESEVVRDTLDTEVHAMKERHKLGSEFMTQLGIYAPTFGIVGAVFGLIATMAYLDQHEKIGSGIAAAFVATFWGVFGANGIFLPIGRKLQRLSQMEVEYKQLIIEGVLSIQAGSSPRVVDDLLQSFLPPSVRLQLKGDSDHAA